MFHINFKGPSFYTLNFEIFTETSTIILFIISIFMIIFKLKKIFSAVDIQNFLKNANMNR